MYAARKPYGGPRGNELMEHVCTILIEQLMLAKEPLFTSWCRTLRYTLIRNCYCNAKIVAVYRLHAYCILVRFAVSPIGHLVHSEHGMRMDKKLTASLSQQNDDVLMALYCVMYPVAGRLFNEPEQHSSIEYVWTGLGNAMNYNCLSALLCYQLVYLRT